MPFSRTILLILATCVVGSEAMRAQQTDTTTKVPLRPLPTPPRVLPTDSANARRASAGVGPQAGAPVRRRLFPRLLTGAVVGGILGVVAGSQIDNEVVAGCINTCYAEPDNFAPIVGLIGAAFGALVGLLAWWLGL